jgi:hypothetical protein
MNELSDLGYRRVINEICDLRWERLSSDDMVSAAWGYHYFSIQFRESLQTARALLPADEKLQNLEREECDTDNLSPWPGVARPGERMNHDEFMRRTLELVPIDPERAHHFGAVGAAYLKATRSMDPAACASAIASYEDGGLENVFTAMLRFSNWDNSLLLSFRHFLSEHIRFDSDPDAGHGALSRHLAPDGRVLPLWESFRDLLVECVPALAEPTPASQARV